MLVFFILWGGLRSKGRVKPKGKPLKGGGTPLVSCVTPLKGGVKTLEMCESRSKEG